MTTLGARRVAESVMVGNLPSRYVLIFEPHQEGGGFLVPPEFIEDLRRHNPSVVVVAAFSQDQAFGRAIAEGDSPSGADNAAEELLGLARVGDRAAFEELARCLMPAGDAGACWDGARRRLGLAVSSGKIPPGPPDPPSTPHPRRFA